MSFSILGIITFVLLLLILVGAHELGHYWFARLFKMDVEEFALGMGPKPWVWRRRGETIYTVRPIPIGGFVRIKGMNPEEDGSEVSVENGFYAKPPWQRFAVLAAGPLFSLLFGWLTFFVLFLAVGMGKPELPIIGGVAKGSVAASAGLKKGDRIVSVEGKQVQSWFDMLQIVRDRPGKPTHVSYSRAGQVTEITLSPTPDEKPTEVVGPDLMPTGETRVQGRMGVIPALTYHRGLGIAWNGANSVLGLIYEGLKQIPHRAQESVGGPIAIASAASEASSQGIESIVILAGQLSISLGILNLLPIPPFDGGQMVVAFVEMLRRGRRLSFRVQNLVYGTGFMLIAALIITVFAADISKLFRPKAPEKKFELVEEQPVRPK